MTFDQLSAIAVYIVGFPENVSSLGVSGAGRGLTLHLLNVISFHSISYLPRDAVLARH